MKNGELVQARAFPKKIFLVEFPSKDKKREAMLNGPHYLNSVRIHLIDWYQNFDP